MSGGSDIDPPVPSSASPDSPVAAAGAPGSDLPAPDSPGPDLPGSDTTGSASPQGERKESPTLVFTHPDDPKPGRSSAPAPEASSRISDQPPGSLTPPASSSITTFLPVERNQRRAALLLSAGCVVLAMATVGLLSANIGKSRNRSNAPGPVPVAAASGPVAAPAPENTVVAPLAPVKFTPGPPAIPGDLNVYATELTASIRPFVAVELGEVITETKPWSSHLYGTSDLPANTKVPVDINNQALCMIAQINLAELPALPVASGPSTGPITRLPKAGVLQFWLNMASPGSPTGWTGGPTLQETVSQKAQRVTYIAPGDMTGSTNSVPQASTCTDGPPSRGPAVAVAMTFAVKWNAPETTDARFDSSLPYLAGALRAPNTDEFYRALGSINSWLSNDTMAQIGGFNRLVSQDPRSIDSLQGEGARDGLATDLYEVLFELHSSEDPGGTWSVGFGTQGTGGWWVDPSELAKVSKTGDLNSAFWWDAQAAPAEPAGTGG
jgi:Domain of unknown function (DUF1963)